MILTTFLRKCIFPDHLRWQSWKLFYWASGWCSSDVVSCLSLVLRSCLTFMPCHATYPFKAFLFQISFIVIFFMWHLRTWIPLVFIFTWLWPQLYYLFCVFSIVNIYKTLSKLSKIAFYNLPLYASRIRVTKRRGLVTHPVSQSMWIHFHRRVKGPWFSGLFLFFITQELYGFGDSQKKSISEWKNSWLKCSFTSTLSYHTLPPYVQVLFPIYSPMDTENHFFLKSCLLL